MKLNWFSPLPPAGTDIAQFTLRVLPALRRALGGGAVTVWTDQDKWDEKQLAGVDVRRYRSGAVPWMEINKADLSVFNIGNNAQFHGAIWQISRQHPGLIILHDTHLHHLFYHLYVEQWQDAKEYLRQIAKYYGEAGRRDAARRMHNVAQEVYYLSEQYPLTPLALENSLGALVHSPVAFDLLRRARRWPLAYAPLPFPAAPLLEAPGSLERFSSGPPFQLILFGYIGRNRQLGAILQALAEFEEREQFRLHIYGELTDQEHWAAQIRELGLRRLVQLRGFVPEAKLDAALSAAHLAINLRYPTMGEASGSQLRIWSHALPSLVSETGWLATLPAAAVAFVRPSNEVADLQAHFRDFLSDPQRFQQIGEQGRRVLLEQHAPDVYARALIECAQMAERFRPQLIARQMAERAGTKLASMLKVNTPDMAASKVGCEIRELLISANTGD